MVKVTMEPVKRKLVLRFRRFKPLMDEVKCMRGAEYISPEKGGPAWAVTACRRNRMQMDLMAGRPVPELARYDLPLAGAPRRKNLKPHQVPMFQFLHTRRRCIMAAEQGTGKTLPAMEEMEQAGGDWWYVSTPAVLTSIKLEFEKWGCKVQPRWVSLNSLGKLLREYDGPAPRGVVFDEASFLKGKGEWYDNCQHLADEMRREHGDQCWIFLLTGTPQPLEPTDWHSLAEIACPGFLREATKPQLTKRLAIMAPGVAVDGHVFSTVVDWKEDEVQHLGRRLDGLAYVIFSRDVQNLPELREEIVMLKPSPATLRAARMVVQGAQTAVEALGKARQLSDGFQYTDSGPKRCATPKDGALRDFLARNKKLGRTVCFAPYRESIDRVVEVCRAKGWNVLRRDGRGWACFRQGVTKPMVDEQAVSMFLKAMDRSLDRKKLGPTVFVGHPVSGGFGLNLTAAREGLCYSCDFNWGAHAQLLKRTHREGMDPDHPFTWYYLCHLPTDEHVLKNHKRKRDLSAITLDEIQHIFTGRF